MPLPIDILPEIAESLHTRQPIVALESTIVAHGMPYPQNLETARQLEQTVRDGGAIPATLAIQAGRIKIGLSPDEMEWLAQSPTIEKASRRDLGVILAEQKHAATTVSATMMLASMAGIRIFATGGIGGVHRGAQHTFDISADLQELARTQVAVISAGAKAILDLALTLEYLETHGVPVIGYGTTEFPAFYTRSSGLKAPATVADTDTLAAIMHAHWSLPHSGGILIANPIPAAYSLDPAYIEAAILEALQTADAQGIHGKALTPHLLAEITRQTEGKSLFSNIQLAKNNAQLAASLAVAYQQQEPL
ncbi:MAG: pseudouridine-5'-phosphate glycosidase [Bacteroidia bacterium]|nr:pseudouridine-5'-phosphate glycosidase [Bacteroidia bacterium]